MKTKIAIVVALLLIIGISCLMGYIRSCLLSNAKRHNPDEKIFKSDGLRKALLLFQPSRHGTSQQLVDIATRIFNDSGFTVVQNYASDLIDYDFNEFDTLIFITPVYMGSTAQPINDYIQENFFANKDVYLISSGLLDKKDEDRAELENLKSLIKGENKVYLLKANKKKFHEFEDELKLNISQNG